MKGILVFVFVLLALAFGGKTDPAVPKLKPSSTGLQEMGILPATAIALERIQEICDISKVDYELHIQRLKDEKVWGFGFFQIPKGSAEQITVVVHDDGKSHIMKGGMF